MSARKIQDEIEARECIAKMKKSGLALAQWARSAGIDVTVQPMASLTLVPEFSCAEPSCRAIVSRSG